MPWLCASILPPCISTSRRASASPIPSPLCDRSPACAPCANRSNTRGSISSEMPMPLSVTVIVTSPLGRAASAGLSAAERRIVPGVGVNFIALCTTFDMIWTNRVGSTSTTQGASGRSTIRLRPAWSIDARCASIALCTSSPTAVGTRRRTIFPEVMRDTSSRSSMSRTMWATCRSIIARTRRIVAGRSPDTRISSRPVHESGREGCAARAPAAPGIRPCGDPRRSAAARSRRSRDGPSPAWKYRGSNRPARSVRLEA